MKKYFITGLVILLPAALTLAIVAFLFNLLTQPFVEVVKSFLMHYEIAGHGFLFLSQNQILDILSKLLILGLLFFFTVLLGFLARWFFVHYLLFIGELILKKIPFISTVYKTCQDVIKTIFTSDTKSFKQVVMVPFPNKETQSIGLITRESVPDLTSSKNEINVAVFVPTTPNPTSGYLIMFKPSDLIYLDMKIEDALKYIISCGVIATPFIPLKKNQPEKKLES